MPPLTLLPVRFTRLVLVGLTVLAIPVPFVAEAFFVVLFFIVSIGSLVPLAIFPGRFGASTHLVVGFTADLWLFPAFLGRVLPLAFMALVFGVIE